MSIKSILVPISGLEGYERALEAALIVARQFGSHVEVLHVTPDPAEMIPYGTLGVSEATMKSIVQGARRSTKEEIAKAKTAFEVFCTRNQLPLTASPPGPTAGASADWRQELGRESVWVGLRGRLADLIVVNQPADEWPGSATLEAALLETGRPVLVAPETPLRTLGGNVVIGWNGSAEAASAVAAAMPFIRAAKKVSILSGADGAELRLPAKDLVQHLGWHGVKATAHTFKTGPFSVGKALLAQVKKLGADLLVMGGYGHSRRREMIFGGVTRHVLSAARLPVLMLH
jgi:nucleotide-binding universal stress UspA family protein